MAKYENQCYKRHWVARIEADANNRLHRDFEDGVYVKSRKKRKYDLQPGFYERAWVDYTVTKKVCGECNRRYDGERRDYFCVTNADQIVPIPEAATAWLVEIIDGPLLGEDGSWNGSHCECGEEAAGYDEHMFPYCEDHKPAAATIREHKEEVPF